MKIKSKIFFTALAVAVAGRALAGGILTNTNQSVAFLRHIARGVTLDADAPYYNPAGTAFMDDGWMLSLNIQSAFMTRITTTDYAPFAMNAAHIGVASHRYEGDIVSPCVPNVYATYKRNRWAVFFSAGVTGGGGRVKFRDGLGSFEQPFAVLPSAITSLGSAYGISASQYSMDCSFRGLTMNLSGQIGASYRITDWLSASAMVRLHYARNRYDGHITDIMVNPTGAAFGFDGGMMRADAFFTAVAGALQGVDVDCIQKAWGVSPVLALYFRKGAWSASARYEFIAPMTLENHTERDDLGAYQDGAETPNDIPALLSVAVGRSFAGERVRVTAEYHYFFDKQADMVDGKQGRIDAGTAEYLLGAEYDISPKFTVSAGVQRTVYSTQDAYFSDVNHVLSATSVGFGGAWNISGRLRLNAGYFISFYDKRSVGSVVETLAGNVPATTLYDRRSGVLGVGLDLKFGHR